jgi:hypothetical protein
MNQDAQAVTTIEAPSPRIITTCCAYCETLLEEADPAKGIGVGVCPNKECKKTEAVKMLGDIRAYLRCIVDGYRDFIVQKSGISGRALFCHHCGGDITLPSLAGR